jgi:hypothetical protein
VLVGVAVHRVGEQVGPDAAVVQQRVALARRAVRRDALAGALGADEELEQLKRDEEPGDDEVPF